MSGPDLPAQAEVADAVATLREFAQLRLGPDLLGAIDVVCRLLAVEPSEP